MLVGGNVTLTNWAGAYLYSSATNGTAGYSILVDIAGNMTIATNCWIFPYSHYTNGGSVHFRVASLTVKAGGGIDATAKGYSGAFLSTYSPGYGPGKSPGGNAASTGRRLWRERRFKRNGIGYAWMVKMSVVSRRDEDPRQIFFIHSPAHGDNVSVGGGVIDSREQICYPGTGSHHQQDICTGSDGVGPFHVQGGFQSPSGICGPTVRGIVDGQRRIREPELCVKGLQVRCHGGISVGIDDGDRLAGSGQVGKLVDSVGFAYCCRAKRR